MFRTVAPASPRTAVVDYGCPWPDPPKDEKEAERTMRLVRMLARVRLGPSEVAERGSVQRLPHSFALSLVRTKRAEPV